jgi:hypothetical protein
MCGNLAGIASPFFTGWIVERTGTFAMAFACASIACLAGATSFGLLAASRCTAREAIRRTILFSSSIRAVRSSRTC